MSRTKKLKIRMIFGKKINILVKLMIIRIMKMNSQMMNTKPRAQGKISLIAISRILQICHKMILMTKMNRIKMGINKKEEENNLLKKKIKKIKFFHIITIRKKSLLQRINFLKLNKATNNQITKIMNRNLFYKNNRILVQHQKNQKVRMILPTVIYSKKSQQKMITNLIQITRKNLIKITKK